MVFTAGKQVLKPLGILDYFSLQKHEHHENRSRFILLRDIIVFHVPKPFTVMKSSVRFQTRAIDDYKLILFGRY